MSSVLKWTEKHGWEPKRRHGGSWLSHLPVNGKLQVRMADQAMYHQGNQSVFVGGRLWTLLPPPAEKAVTMLKKEPLQHTGRGVERQSPFRYKFYIF